MLQLMKMRRKSNQRQKPASCQGQVAYRGNGCIIRMINRNERWDLISECQPRKFGELISYIFSDEYVYTHPRLRKEMQADRKGYVDAASILKEHTLAQYFRINQLSSEQQQLQFIRQFIPQYCKELLVSGHRIRRLRPFNASLFSNVKPICLQRLQAPLTISDIRHYLGESAFSEAQQFIPSTQVQFLFVYAPDYRRNCEESMPFRVIEYQKLCAERERESRYWEQQEKRFYMTFSTEIHMQRQHYNEERYRARVRGPMEEEGMEEERGAGQLQSATEVACSPSPVLNQMLSSYMISMRNSLDEE